MKKTLLVLLIVLAAASAAFAEYNSTDVVTVMRGNVAHLNAAGKAADSGDFFAAAKEFMAMAEGMRSIRHFEPYKGSKADWDANIDAVVNTALQAVGACGMQDAAKVTGLIGELKALNKKGHGDNK